MARRLRSPKAVKPPHKLHPWVQARSGSRTCDGVWTRRRGFTLIEVMVALGIVATALVAALQAVGSLTRDAARQADVLLAHVCAENEMAKTRLSKQMPGVGNTVVACEQAGRAMTVTVSVLPTPNPNFRRVDAQVMQGDVPVLRLSTVLGRF